LLAETEKPEESRTLMKYNSIMDNNYLEISESELTTINGGGIIPSLVAGLIIAGIVQIISDWDNFKNGIAGRRETK
jgi:hypothetical protein